MISITNNSFAGIANVLIYCTKFVNQNVLNDPKTKLSSNICYDLKTEKVKITEDEWNQNNSGR